METEKLRPNKSGGESAGKKQIYVVDDDNSICRALSILLGTYGFIVNTFTSSVDFFSTVPNSADGCLILDIHMPVFDGWDTLQHLITLGSTRPVVIISADKNGGIRERALKAGAAGYLQKPLNSQDLVSLINDALDKSYGR